MKVYAKFKVVAVSEEQQKRVQKKVVPMAYVIVSEGDSFMSLTVWGEEKIHLCKEKLYAGTEMECLVSITGKEVERDDGTKQYFNNFNLVSIL